MHYSAKRGLAVTCRLSVRPSVHPSVCDVGGSWPHRWKILETNRWSSSPTFSLFVAKRSSTYSQGNMKKFWGRLGTGWERVACWSTKVAISLKRVKIEEKLLWRAYRKSSTLFRFFGSQPYFYFRFGLYCYRDGRFCLIFARIAQQSVLDGTNGFSNSKPCAYCRIVRSRASRGNLCDSITFLLIDVIVGKKMNIL